MQTMRCVGCVGQASRCFHSSAASALRWRPIGSVRRASKLGRKDVRQLNFLPAKTAGAFLETYLRTSSFGSLEVIDLFSKSSRTHQNKVYEQYAKPKSLEYAPVKAAEAHVEMFRRAILAAVIVPE